jgi:hypothetical protein
MKSLLVIQSPYATRVLHVHQMNSPLVIEGLYATRMLHVRQMNSLLVMEGLYAVVRAHMSVTTTLIQISKRAYETLRAEGAGRWKKRELQF